MIELASGLFALGGVALAGLLSEVRAARDARARRIADLQALRRNVYTNALRRVEAVASAMARWVQSDADSEAATRQAVWDALTAAYEVVLEVQLIGSRPEVGEAMGRMLWAYRTVLEEGKRELPKPTEHRRAMIEAFRADLGMPA